MGLTDNFRTKGNQSAKIKYLKNSKILLNKRENKYEYN